MDMLLFLREGFVCQDALDNEAEGCFKQCGEGEVIVRDFTGKLQTFFLVLQQGLVVFLCA